MKTKILLLILFIFCTNILTSQTKEVSLKLNPNSVNNQQLKLAIENNASKFFKRIEQNRRKIPIFSDDQYNYISEEALKKITEIVGNTRVEILQDTYVENLLKTQNGYQIRNISVKSRRKKIKH